MMDAAEDLVDGLKSELDSALRHVVLALRSGRPDQVAWWMCANHASFLIDHPNLVFESDMIEMAERAGSPPKGASWKKWFDRVRNLKAKRTRASLTQGERG